MQKFRKGDKVICINAKGSYELVNGKEYIVIDRVYYKDCDEIVLLGLNDTWRIDRFVLSSEYKKKKWIPKKGDTYWVIESRNSHIELFHIFALVP